MNSESNNLRNFSKNMKTKSHRDTNNKKKIKNVKKTYTQIYKNQQNSLNKK